MLSSPVLSFCSLLLHSTLQQFCFFPSFSKGKDFLPSPGRAVEAASEERGSERLGQGCALLPMALVAPGVSLFWTCVGTSRVEIGDPWEML